MGQGHHRMRRAGAILTAALIVGTTLASTVPASAFGRYGGYHRHRGIGVGAAVGLGIGAAALGAVAAGAASQRSYNGYPVYSDGYHRGYGYDYYPDHGGYYGPY